MTDEQKKARNLAVLVGNGLSIAMNPGLELKEITRAAIERIGEADGDDAVTAMKQVAATALSGDTVTDEDFEVLVGSFGSETRTLNRLRQLAEFVQPSNADLSLAIRTAASFAEQVRDSGVSHVLGIISERCHLSTDSDSAQQLFSFLGAILSQYDGRVVVGNLNYDTILLAALMHMCPQELADLGDGVRKVNVTFGQHSQEIPALRLTANFPADRRVRLLQLHGSLTFWSNRDRSVCAKLPVLLVSWSEALASMRDPSTALRPLVVLTSQRDKAEHVSEYPFSLAYDSFDKGLSDANHWLIVGYSFRDACVNERLRLQFAARNPKPCVLVVTKGESPTRKEIEQALGWAKEDGTSSDWLKINRDGALGVDSTDEWKCFVQ